MGELSTPAVPAPGTKRGAEAAEAATPSAVRKQRGLAKSGENAGMYGIKFVSEQLRFLELREDDYDQMIFGCKSGKRAEYIRMHWPWAWARPAGHG